jgi:hypothetical protein
MADRFSQMAVKAALPSCWPLVIAIYVDDNQICLSQCWPYPLNVSQAVVPYVNLTPDGSQFYLFLRYTSMKFFFFFAETETLWSQGPVTKDFWKPYSIRPRYSTFKHFRVCSASNEIRSAHAQCAMKFVPRMLSMDLQVKTVHILPLAEHARKLVPRMLSIHEIVSSYAQRAIKSFLRTLSTRML